MCEIRVYEACRGRLEAPRARLLAEVVPRRPKHGIELVGVFNAVAPDGKLTSMTRLPSEEARVAGRASFGAAPGLGRRRCRRRGAWTSAGQSEPVRPWPTCRLAERALSFGSIVMKAAPFSYLRAARAAEACAAMAGDASVRSLAGRQTLVSMTAMRLARPSHLIEIAHGPGKTDIAGASDRVSIGATMRQAAAARSELVARELPLLTASIIHIGHPPTHSRGTVGGSIRNADLPAAFPREAVTLGPTLNVETETGPEAIEAIEFFIGPMLTTMPEHENTP